jgi:hypothetical protein
MQIIYQQTFTDFSHATAAMFGAGMAISTRSLPEGETVAEFAADFLKKSLARRFSEGFDRIHSALYVAENEFTYNFDILPGLKARGFLSLTTQVSVSFHCWTFATAL